MPYKDRNVRRVHNRVYNLCYYRKNSKALYRYKVARKLRISAFIQDYKRQHPCACGEGDPRCLDFHHKKSSEKTISVALAPALGWALSRVKKEIKKCSVLCANCHRKTHLAGGVMGNTSGFVPEDSS